MPFPISFATTLGISFDFFSSSYLDVSVHWVLPFYPMYSDKNTTYVVGSPIRIFTIITVLAPYRNFSQLSRPSSSLNAQASIKCSSLFTYSKYILTSISFLQKKRLKFNSILLLFVNSHLLIQIYLFILFQITCSLICGGDDGN